MRRTRRFPVDRASVGAARRFVSELLVDVSPPDVIDAIELMVSELATNCIRHASAEFELTLACANGRIRVEVTDRAPGRPMMRSPTPDDPTGRGLQIVHVLSDAWGVEQRRGKGKTVWFDLASPSAGSAAAGHAGRSAPCGRATGGGRGGRPGTPATPVVDGQRCVP